MRRALLLAALAAPVLAVAQQTPKDGEILFSQADDDTDFVRGRFISKVECETAGSKVKASWNTALTGAFPGNATYQVFASNVPVPAERTSCYEADQTDVKAGSVGTGISATTEVMNFQVLDVAAILAAVEIAGGCSPSGDTSIYVCIQLKANNTVVGMARGTLVLSVTAPPAPTGVFARPADDGALEITWKGPPTTATPRAYDYKVVAASTDARDPNTHTAHEVTGERFVMRGLVNEVPYTINVYSVSEAGNESEKSDDYVASPSSVYDLWEIYRQVGGVDDGGCASGPAGPLALLGIAALLALLRRRA